MVPLFFPAPGVGVSMNEIGLSMGPAALRAPGGPLPADPADDVNLSADLQSMKQEADRRISEWETTGRGLVASSLADAAAFFSTGLGEMHSHDAQLTCFITGGNEDLVGKCLNIDTARFFDDPSMRLAPDAESIFVMANSLLPHSQGEIVLASKDPAVHPPSGRTTMTILTT